MFDTRARHGVTTNNQEELWTLILDVYQQKNNGLKRLFPDPQSVCVSERNMKIRELLKSYHGSGKLSKKVGNFPNMSKCQLYPPPWDWEISIFLKAPLRMSNSSIGKCPSASPVED